MSWQSPHEYFEQYYIHSISAQFFLFRCVVLILVVIGRKNAVVNDVVVVNSIMQSVHFMRMVTPGALKEI